VSMSISVETVMRNTWSTVLQHMATGIGMVIQIQQVRDAIDSPDGTTRAMSSNGNLAISKGRTRKKIKLQLKQAAKQVATAAAQRMLAKVYEGQALEQYFVWPDKRGGYYVRPLKADLPTHTTVDEARAWFHLHMYAIPNGDIVGHATTTPTTRTQFAWDELAVIKDATLFELAGVVRDVVNGRFDAQLQLQAAMSSDSD